jgi:hypothetical protein
MAIFVSASGARFIECNCCNDLVQSLHGSIVNGKTNDITPSNWKTDIIRRNTPHGGYYWRLEHFCPKCKG